MRSVWVVLLALLLAAACARHSRRFRNSRHLRRSTEDPDLEDPDLQEQHPELEESDCPNPVEIAIRCRLACPHKYIPLAILPEHCYIDMGQSLKDVKLTSEEKEDIDSQWTEMGQMTLGAELLRPHETSEEVLPLMLKGWKDIFETSVRLGGSYYGKAGQALGLSGSKFDFKNNDAVDRDHGYPDEHYPVKQKLTVCGGAGCAYRALLRALKPYTVHTFKPIDPSVGVKGNMPVFSTSPADGSCGHLGKGPTNCRSLARDFLRQLCGGCTDDFKGCKIANDDTSRDSCSLVSKSRLLRSTVDYVGDLVYRFADATAYQVDRVIGDYAEAYMY